MTNRFGKLTLTVLTITTALSFTCLADETESAVYSDLTSDIAYIEDNNSNHTLDIYGSQKDAVTKTVIEVHGGGFIGGNKTTNTDHSIVFADAGYVVVTPDYSKIPQDGTNFPDVIKELFTVYNWVGEHAEEYNIDTENIFLSGDSAGGYYVLLSMAIMQDPALQDYFDVELPAYTFSGYVTTCPDTDILRKREYLEEGQSGPEAFNAQKIGADILMDEELMSHMDLFTCTDPSVFEGLYMMTTPADTTTGEAVLKFDAYLTEQGVEHILNSYEGEENELLHVFNISHTDWAESIKANQDEINFMDGLCK